MSCSIVFCLSRTTTKGVKKAELSFHTFPKCPEIRSAWIRAVRRENWVPNKYSRLCCKHFEQSCFIPGLLIKKLKSDAIPTIFEGYPKYYQSVVKKRKLRPRKEEPQTSQRRRKQVGNTEDEVTPKDTLLLFTLEKVQAKSSHRLRMIKTLRENKRRALKKIASLEKVVKNLKNKQLVEPATLDVISILEPSSSSKDVEFLSKLEDEIGKIFSQSKLEMYNRCFYLKGTDLNDELPAEDVSLYTLWGKYKHLCSDVNLKKSTNTNEKMNKEPEIQENKLVLGYIYNASESGNIIDTGKASKSLISISNIANSDKNNDGCNNDDAENQNLNQGLVKTGIEAASKNMPSKSYPELILRESDIVVPSPSKKTLVWPEPSIKKASGFSKEKIPSAITCKALRVFQEKKDLDKKEKENSKKQKGRLKTKKEVLRDDEKNTNKNIMKKNNSTGNKQAIGKRRVSVTSSESTDSDATYGEAGTSVDETHIDEEIITIPDEPTGAKKRNLIIEEVGSSSADTGRKFFSRHGQNMTTQQKVPLVSEENEQIETTEPSIRSFLRNMGTEDCFLVVCEEDQEMNTS